MDKKFNKNRMTMVDFAWQDKRSSHAILRGYSDGREKLRVGAKLDEPLLTDEDIDSLRGERMPAEEARELLKKILFHGTGVMGMVGVLSYFYK